MQIRNIILYNPNGKKRILPFNLGKVNIISGESKSGKTALVEIVDYCLASSSCNISDGIIREYVAYFAIIVNFSDGENVFIARENPNRKRVSCVSTACLIRNIGERIPEFEELNSNLNIDVLNSFLSQKIGISENTHIPEALTRAPLTANFKHSRFYSYQPQYVVAQPNQLFYNQNKEFVPQSIKDTLPYFLGAVNEQSISIESEISFLRKKLNKLIREKRESEKIKTEGISKAYSLVDEAKEIGILSGSTHPKSEKEAFEMLKNVTKWENEPMRVTSQDGALKELIDKRLELKNSLGKIRDNRKAATDYLKNSFGYSSEVKQQEIRLQSLLLFKKNEKEEISNCPLCESDLTTSIPTVEEIRNSLLQIQDDLKHTNIESPRIQSYIDSVNQEYTKAENELEKIEKSIVALYEQNETARTLKDLNIRRGKVIGRASLYLESVDLEYETTDLDKKIFDLNLKITELEELIDGESEKDRLLSILNKINLQMSMWVSKLDVEERYLDAPIRFDINKLTLFIDSGISPSPLHQIGSGANWVSYHLLILFSLHKHFVDNNRPIPRFLFIDQPTQVYYPPEESNGLVEVNSDKLAVDKMYDFIFNVVELLAGKFQVIITDHAYLKRDDFKNSMVEEWRGGTRLIPEEWILENETI